MLPDINLLPRKERKRSLFYTLFLVGLAIALLLMLAMAYQYFAVTSALKKADTQNAQLTEEKAKLEASLAKKEVIDAGPLNDSVVYLENYVTPTSKLIDQLMTVLPETAYLKEYNYTNGEVKVVSQFETMTDASVYLGKLNASKYINGVKVESVQTEEPEEPALNEDDESDSDSERVRFDVVPRYNFTYSFGVSRDNLKKKEEEQPEEEDMEEIPVEDDAEVGEINE